MWRSPSGAGSAIVVAESGGSFGLAHLAAAGTKPFLERTTMRESAGAALLPGSVAMSTPTAPVNRPDSGVRTSTGTQGLDVMLMGGLLPGRPYLVVGPSGTGKTSLALQFLVDGIRRGEKCLLVTLEEPPNEIRQNHRGLLPELDRVFVFDAIPDVMRYERAPFKDIAQVRESVPFSQVAPSIRKTAELQSVEVTFSALEQTLKMEIARRSFSRIVIDSLTALQYFCMKGFDETLGAQTFLRFLSDLRITTLLTVEAPLEDVETPERLLARGEIRLFRWELDGRTVRALGVEKFRGSQHDARLHPYRISSQGIDLNLEVTISRDTRQVIRPEEVQVSLPATTEPADGLGRLEQDTSDLASLGVSPAPVLAAVDVALAEARAGRHAEALAEVGRARGLVLALYDEYRNGPGGHDVSVAARRLAERVASVRAGVPPTPAPPADAVAPRLEKLSAHLHGIESVRVEPAREPPPPRPVGLPSGSSAAAPTGSGSRPKMSHEPSVVPPPSRRGEPPPLPTRKAYEPSRLRPEVAGTVVASPAPTSPRPPAPARAAYPLAPAPAPVPPSPPPPPVSEAPAVPTPSAPPPTLPPPPIVDQPTLVPSAPRVEPSAGLEPPPKRRRRAPSLGAPRRRSPRPAPGVEGVAELTPATEASRAVAEGSPALEPAGPPSIEPVKPKKRRAPSKKKAPPVTSASPGSPPPAEHQMAPVTPAPSPPATEPAAPPPPPEKESPPASGGSA